MRKSPPKQNVRIKSASSSDEDDIPLSQRVRVKKEAESNSDDDVPLSQRKLSPKAKVKREAASSDDEDNVPLVCNFWMVS